MQCNLPCGPDNDIMISKYAIEMQMPLHKDKRNRAYQTMDSGFGQEETFDEGEPENIEMFTNAVKDELC